MAVTQSRVRELMNEEFSKLRGKLAPKRTSLESRALDIVTVEFSSDAMLRPMVDEFQSTMIEWFLEWVKKELRHLRGELTVGSPGNGRRCSRRLPGRAVGAQLVSAALRKTGR